MKWTDLDLDSAWCTIPADVSKTGLAHRVPLTPQAKTILSDYRDHQERRLHEINASRKRKRQEPKRRGVWVFPAGIDDDDSPVRWVAKATARSKKASGIDFRPHDLRRTAERRKNGPK